MSTAGTAGDWGTQRKRPRLQRQLDTGTACGVVVLALIGASYLLTAEPAPRINVRWVEDASPAEQEDLRRHAALRDCQPSGERTEQCEILDTSATNIARLVRTPDVEDTHFIDRSSLTIADDAPRGPTVTWFVHRVPWLRDSSIPRALIAAALALVLGGVVPRAWAGLRVVSFPRRAVPDAGRLRGFAARAADGVLARPTTVAAIVLASQILPIAVHIFQGRFVRLMADDYCSAERASRLGVIEAAIHTYRSFNGRFSADLFAAAAFVPGVRSIGWTLALVLIAWLTALAMFIRLWLPASWPGRTRVIAAAFVSLVVVGHSLFLTPRVMQSLYWASAMHYVIPGLVAAPLVGCLVAGPFGVVRAAFTFAVAFAGAGFSETFTVAQIAVLLVLAGRSGTGLGPMSRGLLLAALAGSVLAFALVAVAPGTRIRQGFFPPPPDPLSVMLVATRSAWAFVREMLESWANVSALASLYVVGIVAGSVIRADDDCRTDRRFGVRRQIVIVAIAAGLLILSFTPAAYALSTAPPPRTQLIQTAMLAMSVLLAGSRLSLPSLHGWTRESRRIAVATVAVWVVVNGGLIAARALEPNASMRAFSEHWDRTDATIRAAAAAGAAAIAIPVRTDWAALDIVGRDPSFWVNRCVSDYYHLDVTAER